MTAYRLGVLTGDGIGPEIVEAALQVLDAVQETTELRLDYVPLPVGWQAIRAHGQALPDSTLEALRTCDAWILGPHDSASYPESECGELLCSSYGNRNELDFVLSDPSSLENC